MQRSLNVMAMLLAVGVGLSMLIGPASAQEAGEAEGGAAARAAGEAGADLPPAPESDEAAVSEQSGPRIDDAGTAAAIITRQGPEQKLSGHITGSEIRNSDGERIGRIQELLIEGNRVVGVLVSTGGVLGFREKWIGLDWDGIRLTDTGYVAAVDPVALEQAPAFQTAEEQRAESGDQAELSE